MILKAVDWRAVLGASALGAAVLALCAALPAHGLPLTYARLALIALAGATAFVLDEPAAAAVAAVPVARARRTAVRSIAVSVPLGVWVTGVLALALRHPGTPVGGLLVEGAGVLAVALGGAAALRLGGREEPGELVASVLGAVLLGVLLFDPPPHSVPMFPVGAGWAASTVLWATVAVGAVIVVAVASTDPGRRQPAKLQVAAGCDMLGP